MRTHYSRAAHKPKEPLAYPDHVPLCTKSTLTSWRVKHQAGITDDGLLPLMMLNKGINFSFAAHSENCHDSLEKPFYVFCVRGGGQAH